MQNIHRDAPGYENEAGFCRDAQLLFVFPAKAVLGKMPQAIKARPFTIDGHVYVAFDCENVFFNTKLGRTAYERAELETSYFLRLPCKIGQPVIYASVGVHGRCSNDDYFRNRLKMIGEAGVKATIAKAVTILADMDGYASAKQDEITAKSQERALHEAQVKQRENERKEAELQAACVAFKNGEYISFGHFEALCNLHGVVMPKQTIGAGRKNIRAIKPGSMEVYGKSRPDMALKAATQLLAKLHA